MYDQNPLLHKVTIDQLAREYQPSPLRDPIARWRLPGRTALMSLAALVVAATVFGGGIV